MSTHSSGLEIVTAIVCDDIRREENGKDILIGVYGSGLRVQALPTFLNLAVWLEVVPKVTGQHQLKMRMVGQNSSILFETASLPVQINELRPIHAPLAGVPLQIQAIGPIELQVAVNDQDWQTYRTINVEVGAIQKST